MIDETHRRRVRKALQELKGMTDEGLIDATEYKEKRAELLSSPASPAPRRRFAKRGPLLFLALITLGSTSATTVHPR